MNSSLPASLVVVCARWQSFRDASIGVGSRANQLTGDETDGADVRAANDLTIHAEVRSQLRAAGNSPPAALSAELPFVFATLV